MYPTITPSIEVTIGRETRLYHAFITTAPTTLDAPATVTLHTAPLADVSGMAADPIAFNTTRASASARLVLVEGTELAWQRARYREARHLLAPADPVLVGLNTLQHWLWSRIGSWAADLAFPNAAVNNGPGRRGRALSRRDAMNIEVKILRNEQRKPADKLADAEIHFIGGELAGLKLVGFAVWKRREGTGRSVTFPARQFIVHGDRRNFALLRAIGNPNAQDRVRDLVLTAYEQQAHDAVQEAS